MQIEINQCYDKVINDAKSHEETIVIKKRNHEKDIENIEKSYKDKLTNKDEEINNLTINIGTYNKTIENYKNINNDLKSSINSYDNIKDDIQKVKEEYISFSSMIINSSNTGNQTKKDILALQERMEDNLEIINKKYGSIQSDYKKVVQGNAKLEENIKNIDNNIVKVKSKKMYIIKNKIIKVKIDKRIFTWQKSPRARKITWNGAVSYCRKQTTNGYEDWKLPDFYEMRTILEENNGANTRYIANGRDKDFWTTSKGEKAKNKIVVVNSTNGNKEELNKRERAYVRCIRN